MCIRDSFTEWANASPPHICPSPPQPPSRGVPPPTTRQGCIRPSTVGLFNYCCEAVAVRMPPFQCHRLQDLPQPWQAPSPPAFRSPPAMRICCCKLPAHDHGPVVGLVVFSIAHGYIPAEGLLAVASPIAAPLPKTGPDDSHGCTSTEMTSSASASASQAGARCAQRWWERVSLPAPAITVRAF